MNVYLNVRKHPRESLKPTSSILRRNQYVKNNQGVEHKTCITEKRPQQIAFEVVFNGAKNAADVVEKIGDLHKKMRDLTPEDTSVQQNNTQNNVFVAGTTEELVKMLKSSGGINSNPLKDK